MGKTRLDIFNLKLLEFNFIKFIFDSGETRILKALLHSFFLLNIIFISMHLIPLMSVMLDFICNGFLELLGTGSTQIQSNRLKEIDVISKQKRRPFI